MNAVDNPSSQVTNTDLFMSDLEEQLFGENGADHAVAIVETLSAKSQAIRLHLQSGLGLDEFKKAETVQLSLQAACAVLELMMPAFPHNTNKSTTTKVT